MTRTVWLASYPKSGNTWVRILLANLDAGEAAPVDINDLPTDGAIASAREPFDDLLLIESSVLTHDESEALRPRVYDAMASGFRYGDDEPSNTDGIRFAKVHDAYTATRNGEPVLGGSRAAAGAIVIVRDPRDIVPSLAHHLGITMNAAIDRLSDSHATSNGATSMLPQQLRQRLLGWSEHVESWIAQTDIPVHVLRYEDLQRDTPAAFAGALAFAGRRAAPADIARAVECSRFETLRRLEEANGFHEAPRSRSGARFFRRGTTGAWRDELTPAQIARIEDAHAAMMMRVGYDLLDHQRHGAAYPTESARS